MATISWTNTRLAGEPSFVEKHGNKVSSDVASFSYPNGALTHPRICVASVDGGIGAGKTTWIDRIVESTKRLATATMPTRGTNDDPDAAAKAPKGKLHVLVAKEPIDLWIQLGAFQRFLKDQRRWAANFQNLTYASRILEWCDRYDEAIAIVNSDPMARVLIILERSPFSDRYFFAELHVDLGNIDTVDWAAYALWFRQWSRVAPSTIDFCVWIATSPDEAVKRIVQRESDGKRQGEVAAYDRTYLDQLHAKHVKYMSNGKFCGSPVLRVDGDAPFHRCDVTLDAMCHTLLAWFDHTLSERDSLSNSSVSTSPALSTSPPPSALSARADMSSSSLPPLEDDNEDATAVAADDDDYSQLSALGASCKRIGQSLLVL